MSSLIPSADTAPPSIRHLPLAKRVELWYELVDEADALVKAGLRGRLKSEDELAAAYREWYVRKMEQHDRDQVRMLQRLAEREVGNGR
ncbi:hypothetical protein NG895_13890 [Aeoliella sp. ICT_H6.2]|uniref:Uncharacterized protein n=1 Tax=Aeoliella straminimaris TaxID=2954799 RepID=A0A9X2JGQ6_9BACT|nr:hypothetical protein [Aeoliella straminimaris]MCO6044996.1 hypothetical protein [Aeoliella straminimaris]